MIDYAGLGLLVILIGFAIVVAALFTSASKTGGKVRGGGVILIGPIPMAFGSDAKWTSVAIVLAIVLLLLSFLLYRGL